MPSSDSVKSSHGPELILGEELGSSLFVTDGEPSSPSPSPEPSLRGRGAASGKSRVEVTVPPVVQKSAYTVFQDEWEVVRILKELGPGVGDELSYDVEFVDGHTAIVSGSFTILAIKFRNA
jgi:hypothetical protein